MSSITNSIRAITDSISASGIGCAGRIAGWAALPIAGLALGATIGPAATLRVTIEGLRDHKGLLHFCLTRNLDYLKCDADQGAVRLSVPAATGQVVFEHMVPGEWSLLLIHDSNGNGKLDKRFGLPREGFGFSRNPAIRFGAPSADDVRFALPAGESHQGIRVRYIF